MFLITILRTSVVAVTLAVTTTLLGLVAIAASLLRVRDRPYGIYDWIPRTWSRILLKVAGAHVVVHGDPRATTDPYVFVANHMSWFDVMTLASVLPRYKFVGKAELFRVPVFGPAIRALGMIGLDRANNKAAFESYKIAGERIRDGNSVVVYPEGTRGSEYPLREFKKGPFVLAIASQVPILPVLVHGTREVMPRGALSVSPARIDVHLLEPVPTAGLTYDDRESLSNAVRARMAEALEKLYNISSPPNRPSRKNSD